MKRLITLCLVAAFAFPTTLFAQEEEGSPQLLNVQTWRVTPSDAALQDAQVQNIVEAAQEAGLSGPNTSWYFWTDNFTYTLVFPFDKMAYFDTPNQFQKLFEGKPGEAMMQEAFAALSQIQNMDVKNEIVMAVPDWTHEPAMPGEMKMAEVDEYWVKAGKDEDFDALAKDGLALFGEIGYPYLVNGHRVLFGDVGRMVFVTFYDDRAKFEGEYSLMALLEKAGRMDDWNALGARFVEIVDRMETSHITYRPDLSYQVDASAGEPGEGSN